MQIGIWLPVYGGWLRTLDQATGPDVAACLAIAQQAEALGFDFLYASENLLNCIHGPSEGVADAWSLLAAIAATTSRVGLAGAVKPGFRSPFLVARMIDTLTQVAGRRLAMNVVCGWWREEFDLSGVSWLDHSGRYERADAFLRSFYRLFDPPAEATFDTQAPGPSQTGDAAPQAAARRTFGLERASLPAIWISGHSESATRMAAEWGDCLFLNGMPRKTLAHHIATARQAAMRWGRRVSIALNAYVIATETRAQAISRRDLVIARRNPKTISFFRDVMSESEAAAWARLDDRQMVDSNAGFDAGLIGSFEDVLESLLELSDVGVDTVVCQFDDPMRDAGPFMKRVIQPLRKEMAGRERPNGSAATDAATGNAAPKTSELTNHR
jgi:dimethylsulfone monooxygenase